MRTSYGFLAIVGLAAASLLFLFALITVKNDSTERSSTRKNDSLTKIDRPTISFGDRSIGPKDAPVTIIEFGDYQCEPCANLAFTLVQVMTARPNDVRLVWKDLPNTSSHPLSLEAATSARCADQQGAFWEYHALLFGNATNISQDVFHTYATALKLDEKAFSECLVAGQMQPLIERDITEAARLGINATPFLFVNDRRISGALSAEALSTVIDEAMAHNGN